MYKNYLFFLVSLFFVTGWSQKAIVLLEVEPSIVNTNEEVTVKVTYNISGDVDVDWPEDFDRNYSTMRGSKIMNDYASGQFIQQNYVSYNGTFTKAGTFTIGPAYVKKGNKIYKSNSVSVTVRNESKSGSNNQSDISAKQLNEVAFGLISISKNTVFEGEPVVFEAKIYSKYSPSLLESYKGYSVSGICEKQDLQKATNNITVKEEYLKNKPYYAFGYDKKVVFLSGAGEKEIDPFELTLHYGFQTRKVESVGSKITVKPLPDGVPASFSGGVGSFSIKRQGVSKKLKQGDVFSLIVEISGTGNLQQLSKPNLDLGKNFTLYGDPTLKEDFTYSSMGAEGKITITYNLQVIGKGAITLPEILFSYFDPVKEKYVELKTGAEELTVEANENFQLAQKSTSGKSENFRGEPSNGASNSDGFLGSISSSPVLWGITALPLLLAFMWYFGVRRKRSEPAAEMVLNASEIHGQDMLIKEPEEVFPQVKEEVDLASLLKSGEVSHFYKAVKRILIRELRTKFEISEEILDSQILDEIKVNISDDTYSDINRIVNACEQGQFGLGLTEEENHSILAETNALLSRIAIS